MVRHVGVRQYKEQIVLRPYAVTTVGLLKGSEPIEAIPVATPPQDLGEMIFRVLDNSGNVVPHPSDFTASDEPLQRAIGIKSLRTFYKSAAYCSIAEDEGEYEIVPYRKILRSQGEVGIDEAKQLLHRPSAEDLGRAVQYALKIADEAEPQPR